MTRRFAKVAALAMAVVLLIAGSAGPVTAAAEDQVSAAAVVQRSKSQTLIRAAARAIGGYRNTRRLGSLQISATGTRWTLDEGQIAGGGAAIPGPYSVEAAYDVAQNRFRLDYDLVSFGFVSRQITEIVDGDEGYLVGQDNNFAPPGEAAMLSDRLASTKLHHMLMNPQLLLKALLDGDMRITRTGRTELNGRRHDFVDVQRDGTSPLRVFFDRNTKLILQVSTVENDPLRRDVPIAVSYDDWKRIDRTLRVPMTVQVHYDGELVQDERRTAAKVNRVLDDSLFAAPPGVVPTFDPFLHKRGIDSHQHLQSFAALGFPRDGVQLTVTSTELAPGVHWVTGGSHHSLLVEHDDGLVLVDAPLDEYRAKAILDYVATTFPDAAITHIAQSHHHADHSAGVRTIVAAGATLAVHESAEDFWGHVLAAPSTVVPDSLATNPVPVDIVTVADGGSSTIGSGANAVQLHSYEQGHADDYLLAVAGGVAFIVDILNPNPAVPLPPEGQAIIDLSVERGFPLDVIAGGHGGFIVLP